MAGHSHTGRARIIERVLLLGDEALALLDKALAGIEWARAHDMWECAATCAMDEMMMGPGFMERVWRKHRGEECGPQSPE